MILAGAVGGSIFVHGGGGRGFVQETALCRTRDEKHDRESGVKSSRRREAGDGAEAECETPLPSVFPRVMPG